MGAVFEVRHETIEKRAAIKILRPEYAQTPDAAIRFINEARSVNRVEHPGLIQIYDFVQQEDGTSYIVMEYLGGETVSSRLKKCDAGYYSIRDVIAIGWQIAESLAAAHAKGIVHRDLKPSNVMIVPDPHMPTGERTKVLDFGLAKIADAMNVANTRSSVIMGTPLYMSPEQCEGANHVDERSDVYSLGCMLYEMLTGRPPFIGDGSAQILGMHMFRQPIAIADKRNGIPQILSDLVDRALLKNRERRPSMKEVADGLRALDESESPRAINYQSAQGSARKRINRLLRYSAYLISVVLIIWIDRTLLRRTLESSGKRTETVDGGSVQPYRLSVMQEQQASGGRAKSLPAVTPPGFVSPAGAAVGVEANPVGLPQGSASSSRRRTQGGPKGKRGRGSSAQSSVDLDDLFSSANGQSLSKEHSAKESSVEAELPSSPTNSASAPATTLPPGRIQLVD